LSFIAGLLPYAYLPIAAIYNEKGGSWGHVSTFSGFLQHVLRKDYGTFRLFSGASGRNAEGFWKRTEAYILDAGVQGLNTALPLACLGGAVCILATLVGIFYQQGSSSRDKKGKVRHVAVTAATTAAATSPTATSTTTALAEDADAVILSEPAKKSKGKKKHSNGHAATNETTGTKPSSGIQKEGVPSNGQPTISTTKHANPSVAEGGTAASLSSTELGVNENEAKLTPVVLLFVWMFYFAIFHSLANLPLGDKLLFGVHQRFWMQPNILLFAWAGVGFDYVTFGVEYLLAGVFSCMKSAMNKRSKGGARKGPATGAGGGKKSTPSGSHNSGGEIGGDANWYITGFTKVVSFVVAVSFILVQYTEWETVSNQNKATYFKQYATALLAPLPQHAVVLINYDMQWTSARYMQQCEGFRPDLTIINLSMMTYAWFQHKRRLFPHLTFPGSHYGVKSSAALSPSTSTTTSLSDASSGTFTLYDFLDANIQSHDIYLGGKLSFSDPHVDHFYELVPVGLVRRFVPKSQVDNGSIYAGTVARSWAQVTQELPRLPDVRKYPEETWEWTIGRDFKDRVAGENTVVRSREGDPIPYRLFPFCHVYTPIPYLVVGVFLIVLISTVCHFHALPKAQ
jgi:hypothetical protein